MATEKSENGIGTFRPGELHVVEVTHAAPSPSEWEVATKDGEYQVCICGAKEDAEAIAALLEGRNGPSLFSDPARVAIPQTVEQARAMVNIGMMFLQQHVTGDLEQSGTSQSQSEVKP